MSGKDDTWKFWSRFVFDDCQPYVALYLAIRSENWSLRIASLKQMAADFTAWDHPIYQKLISQHVVDILNMPTELIEYFEKGGFALSISGRALHSVGLDESHEMLINRHVKQAIVRPSKDYINRIAQYIPCRVKSFVNFKTQIFGSQTTSSGCITSPKMFSPEQSTVKSETNIQSIMEKLADGVLLPHFTSEMENRGLVNPFRGRTANDTQKHDLLNFHLLGTEHFETRVMAYVLKTPSVVVPLRRKKLHTFTTSTKTTKRKVMSLQQEMKQVQKCMRRKIAFANKTGTTHDVIGQQYIEFPQALCETNGLPVKRQKSIATKFYQARYKDSELITHSFSSNWTPDTVILEGMFLINTKPLHFHKIMTLSDYGNFLLRRFILPYFRKGSQEVHLLFDDPGRKPQTV